MKKLTFAKETLRVLQDTDLRMVVGGIGMQSISGTQITATSWTVTTWTCPSSSAGGIVFANPQW